MPEFKDGRKLIPASKNEPDLAVVIMLWSIPMKAQYVKKSPVSPVPPFKAGRDEAPTMPLVSLLPTQHHEVQKALATLPQDIIAVPVQRINCATALLSTQLQASPSEVDKGNGAHTAALTTQMVSATKQLTNKKANVSVALLEISSKWQILANYTLLFPQSERRMRLGFSPLFSDTVVQATNRASRNAYGGNAAGAGSSAACTGKQLRDLHAQLAVSAANAKSRMSAIRTQWNESQSGRDVNLVTAKTSSACFPKHLYQCTGQTRFHTRSAPLLHSKMHSEYFLFSF
jgi:hypothetical protein